jgi:phosphoglycerol transferase MdoB-like AlkP superfamily enzyme
MIPLIVIGIRGGLDESTTNVGQVYFSQNQFLNHSAVNPVFNFLASFEKTATNDVTYHFMDDSESQRIVSELYNTQSIDCDTLLTTQTPNIILILLESCGGQFTEISGRTDVTPNLNRLAHEGIYFSNCYANSWRTDRGTVCTWSGYPSFPTMSVMKMPVKSNTVPNIARTLQQERGYETHYIYGGDINFTNMRSYLVAGGFQNLTWKKDYTVEEQNTAKWGVRDDITFETLRQLTTTMHQPFLIGYSTLSSHVPWDVPIQHFDDEVLNAFYYLDQCVGNFIEGLRKTDLWNHTLVVMLPDHGIVYNGLNESNPLLNHIPMIWVGGAVKEARQIDLVCNQTDLAATLLGQLGLNHDDYAFSRDVLSATYLHPFAIHTYDDGYTIIDSTSFVNYDFISDREVTSYGANKDMLMQRAKAILQAATKDLKER